MRLDRLPLMCCANRSSGVLAVCPTYTQGLSSRRPAFSSATRFLPSTSGLSSMTYTRYAGGSRVHPMPVSPHRQP